LFCRVEHSTSGEDLLKAFSGLMCELMAQRELTETCDHRLQFRWTVGFPIQGDMQAAGQVLVLSIVERLTAMPSTCRRFAKPST